MLQEVRTAQPMALPLGTPAQFQSLKALLTEVDYTEAGICARTRSKSISTFEHRVDLPLEDALSACILLFLHDDPVAQSFFTRVMPADAVDLMQALGLLQFDVARPDHFRAPLSIYPIRGFYLVSDQLFTVVGLNGRKIPEDVVYPALANTTCDFLDGMPETDFSALLDLGTGTGIAALLAARSGAGQVWAVDITERSSRMCEYNARLNGIDRVTVRTGDLYEPVNGLTFDRIVAHPPYVPEPETHLIYRDGGADGEQITRRIITGLPQYLRPGGSLYCRCLASDRKGAPLEQRIRAMLGPSHKEYDVVLATNVGVSPAHFYLSDVVDGTVSFTSFEQYLKSFREVAVENLIIAFIHIYRHDRPQTPLTVRRTFTNRMYASPSSIAWLVAWERAGLNPEFSRQLVSARPTVSPYAKIQLTHQMRDGRLRALVGSASTDYPFGFSTESSPGIVLLLGACDGSRTVAELHDEMKRVGVMPADGQIEDFLQLVNTLVSGAVLELDSFKLPEQLTVEGRWPRL
ncbi:MAG: methyltransferase [Longimicrobiales bacterium]